MAYSESIEEHGKWCLDHCMGKASAELQVPAKSVLIYAANEARIIEIMEANRREK